MVQSGDGPVSSSTLRSLWRFSRRTAPLGQAVVLALFVSVLGGALLALMVPSHEAYVGFFQLDHSDPDTVLERALQKAGPTYERCTVGPVPSGSTFPASDRANRVVECPMGPLLDFDRFRSALAPEGGQLIGAEISTGFPPPDQIHPALQIFPSLIPAAVALLLLRNVPWRSDVRRGWQFLRRRPYSLFVSPLLVLSLFAPLASVLPQVSAEGSTEVAEAMQVLALAYGFFAVVLVAPLFEEAVFRHWAYVRTIDRLPVWIVALGTSWGFMLIHILNPQVLLTLAYLPITFVIGLVMFWIRHRSGSIVLTIVAHAVHNGLMSAGFWWPVSG